MKNIIISTALLKRFVAINKCENDTYFKSCNSTNNSLNHYKKKDTNIKEKNRKEDLVMQ